MLEVQMRLTTCSHLVKLRLSWHFSLNLLMSLRELMVWMLPSKLTSLSLGKRGKLFSRRELLLRLLVRRIDCREPRMILHLELHRLLLKVFL